MSASVKRQTTSLGAHVSFDEAVERVMAALGISRAAAVRELEAATVSGELPYQLVTDKDFN